MADPSADRSPAGRFLDLAFFAPLGLAVSVGEILPELARKGRARVEPQMDLARAVGQLAVGQGRRQLADRLPLRGVPSFGLPLPKFEFPMGIKLPLKGFPLGPFAAYAARRADHGAPATAAAKDDAGRSSGGRGGSVNGRQGGARPTATAPGPIIATSAVERPVRPVVRRPTDAEAATGHVAPTRRATRPGTTPGVSGPPKATAAAAEPGPGSHAARRSSASGPASGRQGSPGAATHLAIPSYDALSASQVVQRLAGLSRDEVRAVRAYEASTRGRRTILNKADQLLA